MIKVFVEGKADKRFIEDVFKTYFNIDDVNEIIYTGGKDRLNLYDEKFQETSDYNGTNLIIFDADDDYGTRRQQILDKKAELDIEFELFLFPDNTNIGDLETLLLDLTNTEHRPILACFDNYQNCLNALDKYKVPVLKTKIFAYTDTLLSKKEIKKGISPNETERDYTYGDHWNLHAEAIQPLITFLSKYFTPVAK